MTLQPHFVMSALVLLVPVISIIGHRKHLLDTCPRIYYVIIRIILGEGNLIGIQEPGFRFP